MAGETKILAFSEGVAVTAPSQTPLTTYTLSTKTTTYTALTSDEVLVCDTTSGAFTLTLPTAVGNTGKSFWIIKLGTAANDLTIDPNSSELIDGQATMILSGQYRSIQIVSDNAKWLTVSKDEDTITSKSATYTATQEDDFILVSAGSSWVLTLPAAAGCKGKVYTIVKIDATAFTVTIDGNASETIDGEVSTILESQYQAIKIVSDGTSWYSASREKRILQTVSKTTTYTAVINDDVILCSTAGGAWTLTLPTAIGIKGKIYTIKKTTNDVSGLTIDGNASETIDGAVTKLIVSQYRAITIMSDGANWHVIGDEKGADSMVRLTTANGWGSSSTKIRRFTTAVVNIGNAISYVDSSTLGAVFTINEAGVYAITFMDSSSTIIRYGISLNSAQLTTGIATITAANRLAVDRNSASDETEMVSWTGVLAAGDVIRPHDAPSAETAETATVAFTIAKVG